MVGASRLRGRIAGDAARDTGVEQGLRDAVDDEVGIAADGRGEVGVVRGGEGEVALVFLLNSGPA